MIDLQIPREAVRILEIFGLGVDQQSWSTNRRHTIRRKGRDQEVLILLERTDVERNLVVKDADAAAHHSAIGVSRCEHKTNARRKVAVVSDAVAVVTQTKIEDEMIARNPLVLDKQRIL